MPNQRKTITADTTLQLNRLTPVRPPRADETRAERNPRIFARRPDIVFHGTLVCCATIIIAVAGALRVTDDGNVAIPLLGNAELPGFCASQRLLAIPCPTCGMTRCFVCMAHGQWRNAWRFNAAGVFLFAVVVAQVPLGMLQLYRLRTGRAELQFRHSRWFVYGLLALIIIQWLPKIFEPLS